MIRLANVDGMAPLSWLELKSSVLYACIQTITVSSHLARCTHQHGHLSDIRHLLKVPEVAQGRRNLAGQHVAAQPQEPTTPHFIASMRRRHQMEHTPHISAPRRTIARSNHPAPTVWCHSVDCCPSPNVCDPCQPSRFRIKLASIPHQCDRCKQYDCAYPMFVIMPIVGGMPPEKLFSLAFKTLRQQICAVHVTH
jgi:hypothetical protein